MTTYDLALGAMLTEGPDPELADELQLFGQFVGAGTSTSSTTTRAASAGSRANGTSRGAERPRSAGRLDRACRRDRERGDPEVDWGTTIRFYDHRIGAWRSTWIGPVKGLVLPFLASQVGDEIVLEGNFEEGSVTRWIFSDIGADSFRWRAIESHDGGATWTLRQEMSARRA